MLRRGSCGVDAPGEGTGKQSLQISFLETSGEVLYREELAPDPREVASEGLWGKDRSSGLPVLTDALSLAQKDSKQFPCYAAPSCPTWAPA